MNIYTQKIDESTQLDLEIWTILQAYDGFLELKVP